MNRPVKTALVIMLTYFLSLQSVVAAIPAIAASSDPTDPTAITSGQTVTETLTAEDTEDWYEFEVTADSKVEVELNFPAELDGMVSVLDVYGKPLQAIDADEVGGKEAGTAYLEAGKYLLNVLITNPEEVTVSDSDAYSLKIISSQATVTKDQAEPNDVKSIATNLTIGQQIKGTIMPSGDNDVYKVEVNTAGDLEVTLDVPSGLDLGLFFFDSEMADPWYASDFVKLVDYGTAGERETLKYFISEPGTYYLMVAEFVGKPSADEYTLTTKLNPVKTFKDIKTHWAKSEIEALATRGVIEGMKADVFAPESKVTRGQFATLLVRALDLEIYTGTEAQFDDVTTGDWFYKYVETAAQAGIVNGYSDGSFGPNDDITREQMAAMVVRSLELVDYTTEVSASDINTLLAPYSDKGQVQSWAREELAKGIDLGIVKGVTATTIAPQANAKRAEAAAMIKRMMDSVELL